MTQKKAAKRGRHTRRDFLKDVARTGGALAATIIPSSALGRDGAVAPSERIVLGGVGIGGRGEVDLNVFLHQRDVQCVAVSDVRAERRQHVKAVVDQAYGNDDCATSPDMFEIFDRSDIDAVLIATGDRWHALASMLAAKAGKDIYCEKPCSLTIAESRALADTVDRYERIYQAGTQRRNIANFIHAVQLAHNGKLGQLRTVHANTLNPRTRHEWLPGQPEPPADVVDWDRWLGPCPWRPYNAVYVAGGWREHFDFHGGGILEWGTHTIDLCQWAAEADDTAPVEFTPSGNEVRARYASGIELVMRDIGWLGLGSCSVRFEGDEGWVETGDSGNMAVGPATLRAEKQDFSISGAPPDNHIREFLDCVKSRAAPVSNASTAAQSHVVCHAAYIAWQLGRTLQFDPVEEIFLDDEEANRMRSRAMREPWRI